MSEVPVREYDDEPVHGLPAQLPEGERIVWQGSPCPVRLAKTAFHLRAVAIYFALLVAAMGGARLMGGEGAGAAFDAVFWTLIPALLAIGLILFLGMGLCARHGVHADEPSSRDPHRTRADRSRGHPSTTSSTGQH